jgi:hypothetical protein
MFDQLITTFEPILTDLLGYGVLLIFGYIGLLIRKYLGTKAEAVWRDALHSALKNGALQSGSIDPASVAMDAVDYAKRSVPGAIRKLGADEAVITQLARAKVNEMSLEARLPHR